jgi:hypothetical protein
MIFLPYNMTQHQSVICGNGIIHEKEFGRSGFMRCIYFDRGTGIAQWYSSGLRA